MRTDYDALCLLGSENRILVANSLLERSNEISLFDREYLRKADLCHDPNERGIREGHLGRQCRGKWIDDCTHALKSSLMRQ